MALFNMIQSAQNNPKSSQISYSDMISQVDAGNIKGVTIAGQKVTGKFGDGTSFNSYAPNDPTFVGKLQAKGVQISAKPPEDESNSFFNVLLTTLLPVFLLIAVWIFFYAPNAGRRWPGDGLW